MTIKECSKRRNYQVGDYILAFYCGNFLWMFVARVTEVLPLSIRESYRIKILAKCDETPFPIMAPSTMSYKTSRKISAQLAIFFSLFIKER